jgi:hypothetical protein
MPTSTPEGRRGGLDSTLGNWIGGPREGKLNEWRDARDAPGLAIDPMAWSSLRKCRGCEQQLRGVSAGWVAENLVGIAQQEADMPVTTRDTRGPMPTLYGLMPTSAQAKGPR